VILWGVTQNLDFRLRYIDTSMLVAFLLRRKIMKVIRHNHYLDLGNGSNKFGNHWSKGLNAWVSNCLHDELSRE